MCITKRTPPPAFHVSRASLQASSPVVPTHDPSTPVLDPPDRFERADSLIRIGLITAAFASFIATLFFGYIYDDTGILVHNQVIHGWHSLIDVWKYPYWTDSSDNGGLYRPFLMAIFAAIWNGAHKFAIAFHFFVLLAHTGATLLVWSLARRATSRWAAAAAALWFAVHPVHVEAVANIANSSEVLVAVFALILALVVEPPRGWRIPICAMLYAAALLTKESGAMLPALALIAAWGWRSREGQPLMIGRARVREWTPMIAAWAAVAIAVAIVRRIVLGGPVSGDSFAAPGIDSLSAGDRIWAMFSLGGRVLRLLVWPGVQNPHYGPSVLPQAHGPTMAGVTTVLVLLASLAATGWLALRGKRRDARPIAALLWALVAFFPASNLLVPTGQILAERTLYVASVGVALLVAWGIDALLAVRVVPRRLMAVLTAAVVAVACVRGYVRTREYALVWKTHLRLFTHMIEADSSSYRGHQLLALEMDRLKRPDDAMRLYARAYELAPRDKLLTADYAAFMLEHHRPIDALMLARSLFDRPELHTNPRAVSLLLNSTSAAWGPDSLLVAAKRLDATSPSATSILFVGLANEARHDWSAARRAYAEGLRRTPKDSSLNARMHALNR